LHPALFAFRAKGDVNTGHPEHGLGCCFFYLFRMWGVWINQVPDQRNALFFVAMRQKLKISDLDKPVRQYMQQKPLDEFICWKSQSG
jgi:hypothetical protein